MYEINVINQIPYIYIYLGWILGVLWGFSDDRYSNRTCFSFFALIYFGVLQSAFKSLFYGCALLYIGVDM